MGKSYAKYQQNTLLRISATLLVWNYIIQVEETVIKQNKRNYWKGNYNSINAKLQAVDWEEVLRNDDTECAWNKFKDILHSLVEKNVPLFRVNKKKVPNNPWITKATKRSISKRDKAWRKYREMKTESNIYKRLRNEANRRVKSDQAAYRKRILKSFKGNPRRFYGYMSRAKTVKERVHQITLA